MNARLFIEQFPWSRFGHGYGTASDLKPRYAAIANGTAERADYEYIIYRIEHQATLFWVTPPALLLTCALLGEHGTDKNLLLQHVRTIFEAANYNRKCDLARGHTSSPRMLAKYAEVTATLLADNFDGSMTSDFIARYKSLNRQTFVHVMVLDIIKQHMGLFESFTTSDDGAVAETAKALCAAIAKPRTFKFTTETGEIQVF